MKSIYRSDFKCTCACLKDKNLTEHTQKWSLLYQSFTIRWSRLIDCSRFWPCRWSRSELLFRWQELSWNAWQENLPTELCWGRVLKAPWSASCTFGECSSGGGKSRQGHLLRWSQSPMTPHYPASVFFVLRTGLQTCETRRCSCDELLGLAGVLVFAVPQYPVFSCYNWHY